MQGARHIPVLPHSRLDARLRRSGMSWTLSGPSYFAQNLSGSLAPTSATVMSSSSLSQESERVRQRPRLAAAAAVVVADPARHTAWTEPPTGPALDWY